ncbi:sensor histidine kinase [Litchfieldia salsa]|uniref:Sensor histidine kinase n=1 Tax=Litchfieldia salsa TaxID=930152 RepID=A0A1H0VW71_9BACI|nr:sensor histidine kinase [Litchfieldia salsa]SDP82644.1 two-component system, NarL family, sensor histidine kinase LiaS [Litchfieldia salsa]
MSILQRQILMSVALSILLLLLSSIGIFLAFPLEKWSLLWHQNILDVPFIIILPSITIVIGIVFGFSIGISRRNQLRAISNRLQQVAEGNKGEILSIGTDLEEELIIKKINKLKSTMIEQVRMSQKLATEKAEDQEKRIQELISQERNRLARELHDSVSQQLFAASMLMSAITETRGSDESAEGKQLKMVENMIHQSQLEMRALLLHLRPVALKGKTLQEGIEELLFELTQKVTLEITWKIEEMTLDKGIEDHLFRILQESVSNTLRHAKCTKLEILLILRDDFVILRIVDNGVGFEMNPDSSTPGSYGMQNMQDRATEIGGTLKIVSIKNSGTKLEVKVPMMG